MPHSSLARSLFDRTVHLAIKPRPEDLSQTWSILNLLKNYGPIEYFKHFKYSATPLHGSVLVIFHDRQSAADLLARSKFQCKMHFDGAGRAVHAEDTHVSTAEDDDEIFRARPAGTSSYRIAYRPRPAANKPSSTKPAGEPLTFEIKATNSFFNHRDHIESGPYHGTFSVDHKSVAQEDLVKRVPLIGLSDVNIRKPEKPWRVMNWQKRRERETRISLRGLLEQGQREQSRLKPDALTPYEGLDWKGNAVTR